MSTFRAILFATAALVASVSFAMAAFGSPAAMTCTPAGIESRLAALEAAAQTAMPTDPAGTAVLGVPRRGVAMRGDIPPRYGNPGMNPIM